MRIYIKNDGEHGADPPLYVRFADGQYFELKGGESVSGRCGSVIASASPIPVPDELEVDEPGRVVHPAPPPGGTVYVGSSDALKHAHDTGETAAPDRHVNPAPPPGGTVHIGA